MQYIKLVYPSRIQVPVPQPYEVIKHVRRTNSAHDKLCHWSWICTRQDIHFHCHFNRFQFTWTITSKRTSTFQFPITSRRRCPMKLKCPSIVPIPSKCSSHSPTKWSRKCMCQCKWLAWCKHLKLHFNHHIPLQSCPSAIPSYSRKESSSWGRSQNYETRAA